MDQEDIKGIAAAGPEGFRAVVEEYQRLVYTLCLRILGNSHDAENAAQECFWQAWRSLEQYRGGDFAVWLGRIAANKAIDQKRRQGRLSAKETALEPEVTPQDPRDGPEALVLRQERSRRLHAALEELPDKYAQVLRERYIQALSVKDIARRYEMSEKTVETRLYRAKKLMRERWDEHEDE